jgi:hypothetical protein
VGLGGELEKLLVQGRAVAWMKSTSLKAGAETTVVL